MSDRTDVLVLTPGRDAWSVGDEACRFVELSRGNDYYTCRLTGQMAVRRSHFMDRCGGQMSVVVATLAIRRITGQDGEMAVRDSSLESFWPSRRGLAFDELCR